MNTCIGVQVIDNFKYTVITYGDMSSELYVSWDGEDYAVDLGIDFYFYPIWGYA